MAHGIQIFSSSGTLRLDSEDLMTRILHRQTLASGVSGSVNVPGFNASKGFAIVMRAPGQSLDDAPHDVYTSGTTVNYVAMSDSSRGVGSATSVLIVGMYK